MKKKTGLQIDGADGWVPIPKWVFADDRPPGEPCGFRCRCQLEYSAPTLSELVAKREALEREEIIATHSL